MPFEIVRTENFGHNISLFERHNAAFTRSAGERRGWDIWSKGHRCQLCRPDTHAFICSHIFLSIYDYITLTNNPQTPQLAQFALQNQIVDNEA